MYFLPLKVLLEIPALRDFPVQKCKVLRESKVFLKLNDSTKNTIITVLLYTGYPGQEGDQGLKGEQGKPGERGPTGKPVHDYAYIFYYIF